MTHFCTYRVTESESRFRLQRSVSYGLRLVVGSFSDLSLPAPGKQSLTVGSYHDVEFPAATGGVQPYTYSLTCAEEQPLPPGMQSLPPGMNFASATRRFAGTPNRRFRGSCTYSVTDSSMLVESRAVEIEVAGPVTGTLALPEFVVPGNVLRLRKDERARVTFREATGGVPPYTYELYCPDPSPDTMPDATTLPAGLGFGPQTRVLSGTPETDYRGPDCTYRVADSSDPEEPATVARSVALIIETARAKWRFIDRSLLQADRELNRSDDDEEEEPQMVHMLPVAQPEGGVASVNPVYRLLDVSPPLMFDAATGYLQYVHGGSDPPLGRTSTYRYQVLFGDTVDDTLCIDVSYRLDEGAEDDEDDDRLIASVRIRDDAYFDGMEYRCPSVPLQPASASRSALSNPVHTALAPVHARRAVDAARTAIRDRVRGWSPGTSGTPHGFAITPSVDFASLSGLIDGFDYTGSSESVSGGVELGADAWQVGLVGSFTRTDLRYHAEAGLSTLGYHAGEHDTEILSVHPFAAWHAPSGGHLWASLGAGAGDLRHRDDLGFRSWSRSDVQLRAWAAGLSVPVAQVLSGDLDAEAGIESFAFEIEGGGQISAALPTLRGRDWRAGLAWSAPVTGAPSLSLAWRRSTGDGPEGTRLETRGSVSADGILDPRLSLTGTAAASFGLGDYEQDAWGVGGGARFAPGSSGRGFGLDVDVRLKSSDDERPAGVGVRSEAGYGLWSESLLGTVRPYVGLVRHPGDASVRRTMGLDLRDTPATRVRVEVVDHRRAPSPAFELTVRHRF